MNNTLEFAKALVSMFEDSGANGVSDELDKRQLALSSKYWHIVTEAQAYIDSQFPLIRFKVVVDSGYTTWCMSRSLEDATAWAAQHYRHITSNIIIEEDPIAEAAV